MSAVRTLRWSEEINTLDPRVDYERICYVLSVYEFSWDIEKSLNSRFSVPTLCRLFQRLHPATDEFRDRTRKRYDDTELLMSEISENGQDSEQGQAAITLRRYQCRNWWYYT